MVYFGKGTPVSTASSTHTPHRENMTLLPSLTAWGCSFGEKGGVEEVIGKSLRDISGNEDCTISFYYQESNFLLDA